MFPARGSELLTRRSRHFRRWTGQNGTAEGNDSHRDGRFELHDGWSSLLKTETNRSSTEAMGRSCLIDQRNLSMKKEVGTTVNGTAVHI